ncbi:hypothetical protein HELRODRAFT_177973 [Helobdella robusta]|uniref:Uncharacterized protein n=1 Tax=Helobdella robusta TaxID=6412 RepID=T1FCJ9_HELRO|nr:hypothetical protein HELRODRAFT_177973 [Helobdella robusta]ESN97542.1 hypothetical protein HELRODRAFT_177973 [Helobdella robusta]
MDLLKLAKPLTFNKSVQLACLADPDVLESHYVRVVIKYGSTNPYTPVINWISEIQDIWVKILMQLCLYGSWRFQQQRKSIGLKKLQTSVDTGCSTYDGDGESLKKALDALTSYLVKLSENMEFLQEL